MPDRCAHDKLLTEECRKCRYWYSQVKDYIDRRSWNHETFPPK